MKLKKLVSLGVSTLLIASMALTGCGANQTTKTDENTNTNNASAPAEQTTEADKQLFVEIVAKGFQHDFWQAVLQGTEKAAKELNVATNFVGPANESAIAEQVEQLNNAINKNPDAIALAALDTSAAIDSISTAQSKGIPIVGFDSGVPGAPEGAVVANASTNNYKAGELAAENMYEAIKDKVTNPSSSVRIGVVAQEANSESITQRTAGFVEKITTLIGEDKVAVIGHEKYAKANDSAKVIIEVRIPTEVADNAGKTEALTLLNKEDLIGIYGSNEFAAKCIINANEGMNKLGVDKVIAIGFDAGALQLDAVRSGVFYGSITQNPVAIGYYAVKLAVDAANGQPVSDVDTGCLFYNAENMDSEEIAVCLYE